MESDTSGRTTVKSRDIVPISVSREFLRFGGSFWDMRQKGDADIF